MATNLAPASPDVPDLTIYDLLAPHLSGAKDSAVMMAVFMDAARSAGVEDRVVSYHSSLGVLEWPPIVFEGTRYPGVSELAAMQSAAFGVPPDRHVEVTRTMPGPDGTSMPRSLLTEIAAYGRLPRMGSPYCCRYAKEGVVSSAWTPMVNQLKRELGRPVRILTVMGLRSDEGADREKRPPFRTVLANSARIVDEWLPVKDWPTEAVKVLRLCHRRHRIACEGIRSKQSDGHRRGAVVVTRGRSLNFLAPGRRVTRDLLIAMLGEQTMACEPARDALIGGGDFVVWDGLVPANRHAGVFRGGCAGPCGTATRSMVLPRASTSSSGLGKSCFVPDASTRWTSRRCSRSF
ncbi:hypothetical protein ABZZ74_43110 [Streptomyces sp. NPDC006476]|uniref:hypothetical protein n=1 Tax=Streptomyces sp. NPDC006476 TaxID=3157175 RepID=UPI0033B48311